MKSLRKLLLYTLVLLLLPQVKGQGPDVTPPDFLVNDHSDEWEPGQLLFRQVGLGRIAIVTYHNGVVYAGGYAGRPFNAFEWSDRADATSFSRTVAEGEVNFGIGITQGTHGHMGKVGETLFPNLRRTSTPGVNVIQDNPDWIPFSSRPGPESADRFHDLYFPWRLPFSWAQYGNETGWGWGYRHEQSLGEWDSTAETGIVGHTLMMGNLLFVCSDETFSGVAVYDLAPTLETPPQPPVLLDKLSGRIGGYLPAIWENYLVFASDGEITLVDYSDPENLMLSATYPVPQIPGQDYIQFQDNYAFYHGNKVNMESGTVELELENYESALRPAGSVSGILNTSQYLLPVGNLLVTGGRGTTGEDGVGLWVHQDGPDTIRPEVGYHIPRPNQTGYPTGAAISLTIHETIEGFTAINGDTVILRREDSALPLDCWVSFSHDDILTITPKIYLEEDVEYVVEIVEGGIKDVSGNGIVGHSFHFSTGISIVGGNLPPEITAVDVDSSPTMPGTPVNFTISAQDPEATATLEYRFTAGDGSAPGDWISGGNSFQHTYGDIGHHEAKVQVREQENPSSKATRLFTVTVTNAIPGGGNRPTKSSPITLDAVEGKVWAVNPDNDTVTKLHSVTREVELEVDLRAGLGTNESVDPRSLAVDAGGNLWVVCRDADLVAVLNGVDGELISEIDLGYGSAPIGVAVSPDGASVFVTTEARGHEADTLSENSPANGSLIRFSTASRSRTGSIELGPMPHAIAVFGNGERVLVTRFISGHPRGGEVWDVDASASDNLSLNGTIFLAVETSEDSASNGTGVPNYLSSITISPDERTAWYTATKPADGRGSLFGEDLSFENSMRAMVGRIDLEGGTPEDQDQSRIDFDNADSPTAVAFSPGGDWAFVTAQGNQLLGIFDRLLIDSNSSESSRNTRARVPTGQAPQGIIIDEATGFLWVKNLMDRSVSVHDMSGFLESGQLSYNPVEIVTTSMERLSDEVLTGKTLFYDAAGMSDEGYISCASCHVDGMHDGRTWDFTQRGEGLRNTTDLRGRGGMDHGNVHWTANFDEIQDFENDIRNGFGGHGFLTNAQFDASADPLGTPRAGLSSDLDALAAYVSSLKKETLAKSPFRNSVGLEGGLYAEGAAVFASQNCVQCHDPDRNFTDSTVGNGLAGLHNVGTLRPGSGLRIGATLPGIDTPTLLGVWNGAPYFHNGSAATVEDVFEVAGGQEYQAEDATLLSGTDIRDLTQSNSVSGAMGGRAARFRFPGSGLQWEAVDGGSGGLARLEIFYATDADDQVEVQINGEAAQAFSLVKTQDSRLDAARWERLVVEADLDAGPGNSVRIESISDGLKWTDHLQVSTVNDFAAAEAHTRVAGISAQDKMALISFLQQLDGNYAFVPPGDPLAPVSGIVAVADGVSGVRLSWEMAAGASEYRVYRSSDGVFANAALIGTTAATSFVDADLAPGATRHYWVESTDGTATELSSESFSATTDSPRPDATIGFRRGQRKGDNVYNSNASGQSVRLSIRGRGNYSGWSYLQNDGIGSDRLRFSGTRSNRHFRIQYRRITAPGGNITGAVTSGQHLTVGLVASDSEIVQILVKSTSKKKSRRVIRLGAASLAIPMRSDSVLIRVSAK